MHHICRLNPSLLREKLRIASSHLSCVSLSWGWGLWQDCVSAPSTYFDMGFFLICQICRGHSASFWVSFRGNYCSVYSCSFSVSVTRDELRSLLCGHFNLELSSSVLEVMTQFYGSEIQFPRGLRHNPTPSFNVDLTLSCSVVLEE